MKATGEVMAIDRSFEAALQKAVRTLEIGGRSLLWEDPNWTDDPGDAPAATPRTSASGRSWPRCAAAPTRWTWPRRTGIDPWFLDQLQNIVAMESACSPSR